MNYDKFSVIKNNDDRKAKRIELNKLMGTSSKAFNLFVLASIDFFYHDGNRQINIINDLLRMALQCRGMNDGRLAGYLKNVIPHEIHEKRTMSKKLGKPIAESPIAFGKKEKDYPEFSEVQSFISSNPTWYTYGKENTAKEFSTEKYLNSVVATLKKNKVDLGEFATLLIQDKVKQTSKKVA